MLPPPKMSSSRSITLFIRQEDREREKSPVLAVTEKRDIKGITMCGFWQPDAESESRRRHNPKVLFRNTRKINEFYPRKTIEDFYYSQVYYTLIRDTFLRQCIPSSIGKLLSLHVIGGSLLFLVDEFPSFWGEIDIAEFDIFSDNNRAGILLLAKRNIIYLHLAATLYMTR